MRHVAIFLNNFLKKDKKIHINEKFINEFPGLNRRLSDGAAPHPPRQPSAAPDAAFHGEPMNTLHLLLPALAAAAVFGHAGEPARTQPAGKARALIARGEYLVTTFGCADCHTPWKMGPKGPEPDAGLHLSGHPATLKLPPAPPLPSPWMATAAATMTAWSGPWGVSYTANLTPDAETGLGKWTPQMFIEAMRTGRHQGKGRPILPPMPWTAYRNATDRDLKAIFAYLRSIKPIVNKVPEPSEPAPQN